MAVNRNEVIGVALIGVERVTRLLTKAQILERLYIGRDVEPGIEQTLRAELLELYAQMLRFLVVAKSRLQEGAKGSGKREKPSQAD